MNASLDPSQAAAPPALSTRGGIAYRRFGAGSPLILLHGSVGSWRHWARNIEALAQIRTVFAPDLPGYGDSAGVPPDVQVDAYVDLVLAAILEMCGEGGPVDLVGFSFGGQIAAGVAGRLGKRVHRLALLTPSGFAQPRGRVIDQPRRCDYGRSDEAQREFHRRVLLAMMLADPASADAAAVDIQAANAARARFDGRHISWSGRMPDLLRQVGCPIQLIYGERDPLPFPSSAARIAACRAVRPEIRVDLVPGAGHWLQYERPAEANRLLTEFLGPARYPAGSARPVPVEGSRQP